MPGKSPGGLFPRPVSGRGAGLAGDRERRVLSRALNRNLRVMRLPGGMSGVGGLKRERHGETCAAFS